MNVTSDLSGTLIQIDETSWSLRDLYESRRQMEADLERAESAARQFAAEFRDRVRDLDPRALAEALERFESLMETIGRASSFAYLQWCEDTSRAANGALLQGVRERCSHIEQEILFFELELIQLDDRAFSALLESPALNRFRHYLETQFQMKPHILGEEGERILSEKRNTGIAAWNRFFDETLAATRFPYRGQPVTEQEVLTRLYDPDRDVRRDAAFALTKGLSEQLRTTTFIFNTCLAEQVSEDRLRKFPHWLASRNLSNEISDEAVEALVNSVTSRFDLVARYYRLKRRILGLDEMMDYDRYAPLPSAERRHSWAEARDLILDAFHGFHPELHKIALQFFKGRWIDAAPKPGKRGGAFSHATVPSVHPYILMNFSGTSRDVQTLAHELGHGIHQYLSRGQGLLLARTPLTTSETASVFAEMLVFHRLLQAEQEPEARLALLAARIDDTTATVFRQIAMNRFEDRIHSARRREGELAAERISEFWMESQRAMFQGSVTLGDHYSIWWSYIPHFVHTPGYVYAYAFGELLVLALFELYQQQGDTFVPKYLDLLAAGGSDWPHVLIGRLGVDLNQPEFWNRGLSAIERLIEEAEALVKTASIT